MRVNDPIGNEYKILTEFILNILLSLTELRVTFSIIPVPSSSKFFLKMYHY